MLEASVSDDVDDIGRVAQFAQFFKREKTHAGEVRLHAQHAVELDGMADGLVDLQPELRALENNGAFPFRALGGSVQRQGLLGNALAMAGQIERLHELVAGKLMLAAEAVGVRALLNFVVGKAGSDDAGA